MGEEQEPEVVEDEVPPLKVREALVAVMRDVGAIGKDRRNTEQGFNFRGVEDVMNALAEPFRKHGVLVLPEVREETRTEVRQGKNRALNAVRLRMAFHFHGPAGDVVTAVTEGEGVDVADKATNKAMSAAFKYALTFAFMIPTKGTLDEADGSHEPGVPEDVPSPPTAAEISAQLDKIYQIEDILGLRSLWSFIRSKGWLAAPTHDRQGEPVTLEDVLRARAEELK